MKMNWKCLERKKVINLVKEKVKTKQILVKKIQCKVMLLKPLVQKIQVKATNLCVGVKEKECSTTPPTRVSLSHQNKRGTALSCDHLERPTKRCRQPLIVRERSEKGRPWCI